MIEKTLMWWFKTLSPLALDRAIEQLSPLHVEWWESDSDYRADYIVGMLAKNTQVRITRYGVTGFEVKLTVEAETAIALNEDILYARSVMLEKILPLLDAREIEELHSDDDEGLSSWPSNEG